MKKHRNKILLGTVFALLLALSFIFGGRGTDKKTDTLPETSETITVPDKETEENAPDPKGEENEEKPPEKEVQPEEKEEPPEKNDPPGITPAEEKPETEEKSDETDPEELTCTISIRCDTILNNLERFNKEKLELIPEDGVILSSTEAVFYDGESVFNLLLRETKKRKIHMEFRNTPIHKSAYIEGIANIYEFDCGELSGWMYRVNGVFPNYGCSNYTLSPGDNVEWLYTCDLGADIGNAYKGQVGEKDE